jgi:RNA polymerase sigma-70 factor (ECF subfamily)
MKIFNLASVKYVGRMNIAEPSRLIAECIAGNEDAIEAFVRQYEKDVFRLALSIVNEPTEAHEITQETFITALKSLHTYQERKSLRAWLYTIGLNLSRSHLRKRRLVERLRTTLTNIFRVDIQKQSSPEEVVIQNEKETLIWEALNKLDERQRMVIVLRYFHELSITEISEILSVNEGTIHSRLHTARQRLKKTLEQSHGK